MKPRSDPSRWNGKIGVRSGAVRIKIWKQVIPRQAERKGGK